MLHLESWFPGIKKTLSTHSALVGIGLRYIAIKKGLGQIPNVPLCSAGSKQMLWYISVSIIMRKVTLHSYHITFDDVHPYRLIQKECSWISQKKIFSCRLLLDPKSQCKWRKFFSIEILKLLLHLSSSFFWFLTLMPKKKRKINH